MSTNNVPPACWTRVIAPAKLEQLERAVPLHVDGVSKVALDCRKHGDDRAALMVVGCIVDFLANRKLRHRELLLESSMRLYPNKLVSHFLTISESQPDSPTPSGGPRFGSRAIRRIAGAARYRPCGGALDEGHCAFQA
jgi:hypothetical protein